MSNNVILVPSNKGKNKLIFRGFAYHLERKYKENFRWVCAKNKNSFCKSRLTTTIENNMHKILKQGADHNHAPSSSTKEISRLNNIIKTTARETEAPPTQIIRNGIIACDPDFRMYLPNETAQKQKITRIRKQTIKEPQKLDEINIPEYLRYVEGEMFVLSEKNFRGGKNIILGNSHLLH